MGLQAISTPTKPTPTASQRAGVTSSFKMSHGRGIRGQVENVVGELKGKADLFAESTQAATIFRRTRRDEGAGFAGEADQRAGFHRLQANDGGLVVGLLFRREVERLAAGHGPRPSASATAGSCRAAFRRKRGSPARASGLVVR